ncbi:class I SAM-dependent methyltransferase [Bernardetia sp.]|uniref:class I SAM-dependent methyltransferase n=1 Tax=Bernardetia sp. TaxID=1937974 RepID=UPI0025BA035E|nr:class I SAM-dependent methyltransferase [Bernardetia sp.]
MNNKQLISKQLEDFYNKASEETRLEKGMGIFEFERVRFLIEKYLPNKSIKIVDVGGGTGKYAEWLSKKGHEVHMVEPIPKHLRIAKQRASRLKNKFSVYKSEATQLDFPTGFADVVILHGPLYHLQKKEEREKAIQEAKRISKNNGIIIGFAINHTASTLVGLLNGLLHKRAFFEMCKEELTNGIHNPPADFPWLLTEAFYHTPNLLKEEFVSEGLNFLDMYAVEGMIWLDKNFFSNLGKTDTRKTLMELLHLTENNFELLSFSPHIMIATQK